MANVVARIDGTPASSVADAVAQVGGVEEEFFIEGEAAVFELVGGGDVYPTSGRWPTERTASRAPFKTRIIVERPRDPAEFNGTVLVIWNNVTLGEMFEFPNRAARLIQDGYAIVGVSCQRIGIDGLVATLREAKLPEGLIGATPQSPFLKSIDPERYASLAHPGDDYCYDIFAQGAALVGRDRPRALDPLAGLDVRNVIAVGLSQSGTRLGGFINGAHKLAPVFDAYLLVVYASVPSAMTHASAPPGLPELGGINPGNVLLFHQHYLRDDLGVPIIVLNSEYEAGVSYPNFQPDTDLVRWWDVAGTGHAGPVDAVMMQAVLGSGMPASSVNFAPLYRSALQALRTWLETRRPPPHHPRIKRIGAKFERDAHGNAVGGIRMPDMEAPLGVHVGEAEGLAGAMGSSTPFPPEKVRALYPTKQAYAAKYHAAVDRLVDAGLLLPDDADALRANGDSFAPPS